ncbi:MAG: VIT1/CCC1 transporter family protein [Candidatus Helarchaeota archaeon]
MAKPPKKAKSKDSIFARLKKYAEITEVGEIARRYFVMNAFDGALTTLGIIIGFFLAGVESPRTVVVTTLATALAMGISGIWGAYLAERAERIRELKTLEQHMMTDLSQTIMARASKFATIFSALIDGCSPAMAAIVGIIPFFIGINLPPESFNLLFYISIGLNLILLFILGMFLGSISKENLIWMGVKVVFAGLLITVILFLFNLGG